MKYLYAFLTLGLQFIIVAALKLLENYSLIILIFVGCLLIGLAMKPVLQQKIRG